MPEEALLSPRILTIVDNILCLFLMDTHCLDLCAFCGLCSAQIAAPSSIMRCYTPYPIDECRYLHVIFLVEEALNKKKTMEMAMFMFRMIYDKL